MPDEPQDYELQVHGQQPALLTDDIINRNGTPDDKSVFRDYVPDAWLLRAKPRESEVLKIYAGWLKYVTVQGLCVCVCVCVGGWHLEGTGNSIN